MRGFQGTAGSVSGIEERLTRPRGASPGAFFLAIAPGIVEPMRFTVTHPVQQIRADLRALDRQARFAQVVALTRTAQDGKAAEVAEIDRAIDRPTPYTRGAVYVQPATPARPESAFGLKDDLTYSAPGHQPTNYLRPQIEGGQRNIKAFERLLQLAGHMPQGWKAVPGDAARLDAYGNVSRGQIIQVLSQLRLQLTAGYDRNLARPSPLPRFTRAQVAAMSPAQRSALAVQRRANTSYRQALVRAGGRFFVVRQGQSGKLPPGVYIRQVFGRKTYGPARRFPKAVFVFVRAATYRRRLDWDQVAERTVAERLDYHLGAELDRALATAR